MNATRPDPVRPPERMTLACERYFHEHGQIMIFIDMLFRLAIEADEDARRWALVLLQDPDISDDNRAQAEWAKTYGGGRQITLSRHESLLYQLVYVREVSNFLSYLSELFSLVYMQRPEMLKANDQSVNLDWLLEFESMEDVVSALVERRVTDLSHMGMKDLHSHILKRSSFDLYPVTPHLDEAMRIIEIRNLIVHSRAVVNRHALNRVGNLGMGVGEIIRLEFAEVIRDLAFLARSVTDIDERAAAKFQLATPRERGGPTTGPFPP